MLKTIRRAIKHYGGTHQIIKACEELSELQTVLLQGFNKAEDLNHIAEEMADVEIMLCQLKEIYGNRRSVRTWKKRKLARLEERMSNNV